MSKTSVFYYTNNVAPPQLLEHSFRSTLKHCKNNNCELIVTSHYPITETYTPISLVHSQTPLQPIHQHIVKNLSITDKELEGVDVKNYVVGQLPYAYESIIKQIMFSETKCSGDNIILMEHDVLYPESYIPTVEKCLNGYNKGLTYAHNNIVFLNRNGFFRMFQGSLVLSTIAFKREIFKGIYDEKIELIANNKSYSFEPILDIAPKHIRDLYEGNVFVKDHICIDKFLKNECSMDIKHHLNTDGMLLGDGYYNTDDYWGEVKPYIDLIESVQIEDSNKNLWNYGTGKFNY